MASWEGEGIVLDALKFGDHDAIVTLFTAERGVHRGVFKGGLRPKKRAIIEPGNRVDAQWNARLSEHLGSWQLDCDDAVASKLMNHRLAITALNSLCALLRIALAEQDPHPRLYGYMQHLLSRMCEAPAQADTWLADYVRFELLLLEEAGFGLDLEQCAVTGAREDLHYISPKSGRAVGAVPGKPYHHKLLPFPDILRLGDVAAHARADMLSGLRVTGHFLHHWLLANIHKGMPSARLQLAETLEKSA